MKKLIITFAIFALFVICGGCGGSSDEMIANEPQIPAPIEMQNTADETLQPETSVPVIDGQAMEEEAQPEITYVLNTNSGKFHKPSCRSVALMKPENYQETSASREEVLEMGYTPCGNCKP